MSNDSLDGLERRANTAALLEDLQALEVLLAEGRIETGIRRIGADLEMFLVDGAMHPAPVGPEVRSDIGDPRITGELARFNLEANATPLAFSGTCLSEMHRELRELVSLVRGGASSHGADVVLSGLLPTLAQSDLGLENMTPAPRYATLNKSLVALRNGPFRIDIRGQDEFSASCDSVMMESSNCSFQLHLQVDPGYFATLYNTAQLITAPVLAAAVNSPLCFGRRVWHENRIALFQGAVDSRSTLQKTRGTPPRVGFGSHWLEDGVLEILREQVARFRLMMPTLGEERSLEIAKAGGVPELFALRGHNGTVWSWNRACYGVFDGKAHLRIENRALPSGPSLVDMVANAALYYGLMAAIPEEFADIPASFSFDDAKANFFASAREGLDAHFAWFGSTPISASELLKEQLIPLARQGLISVGVDATEANSYLDIVQERVERRQTGSSWVLGALAQSDASKPFDIRARALTAHMLREQYRDNPVHRWGKCTTSIDFTESYKRVEHFMVTDLFTVGSEDLLDLAASLMDWRRIKHVPVEDEDGHLVGLITHRTLLRQLSKDTSAQSSTLAVKDVMTPSPITVSPKTATLEALRLMREHRIGCLPVVKDAKLVGLITQTDLLDIASGLLEAHLKA
jgi:CBS domain-containing protein